MDITENVLELIRSSNKADLLIEKESGITRGSISNWKHGRNKLSVDALAKIADYFDVSVDYLLGRKEYDSTNAPQRIAYRPSVQAVIDLLLKLDDTQLLGVKGFINGLLYDQKSTKKKA